MNFFVRFDTLVNAFVAEHSSPYLVRIAAWIGVWSNSDLIIVFGLVLGLAFLMRSKWRRAAILLISTLATLKIVQWSKELFGRARPSNAFEVLGSGSFPSGHAALGAAFFTACIYVFAPRIRSKMQRKIFVALCVVAIILIGLSRIVLGVHWATDVVAGWAVGVGVAVGSVYLVRYLSAFYLKERKKFKSK
jgi:membrane-associated phospholipid phosphatase